MNMFNRHLLCQATHRVVVGIPGATYANIRVVNRNVYILNFLEEPLRKLWANQTSTRSRRVINVPDCCNDTYAEYVQTGVPRSQKEDTPLKPAPMITTFIGRGSSMQKFPSLYVDSVCMAGFKGSIVSSQTLVRVEGSSKWESSFSAVGLMLLIALVSAYFKACVMHLTVSVGWERLMGTKKQCTHLDIFLSRTCLVLVTHYDCSCH